MRFGLVFCLALGLAVSTGAYTDPAVHLEAIVTGFVTPVPGGLPGETFWNLGRPAMHQGDVVFEGAGTLGTQGIFCHCGGALVMVASRNDPVPGLPDGISAQFTPLGPPVIHNGEVMFIAGVEVEGGTIFFGLYAWAPPGLAAVVDRWTVLPQGQPPEDTTFWVNDLGLDEAGATFLFGGANNTSAIYQYEEGVFETRVSFNIPFPSDPAANFSDFGDVVSEGGDLSFFGRNGIVSGVIKWVDEEFFLVVGHLTQVPGGEPGEVFQGLNLADPVIGNGNVIFAAGTSTAGEGGFYREKNGVLQELATTRTINPLTGTLFNEFDNKKSADGDNYAIVAGTDNENLFYGDADDRLYAITTKGEELEGQIVQFFTLGKHAVSGSQLVFSAFRETDEVIYVATIGEPVAEIPTLHPAGRFVLLTLMAMVGLLVLHRV